MQLPFAWENNYSSMTPYDNLILLRCIALKAKLLPAMWCVHTNPHALFNVGGRNLLTQADHKLCKLTNFDDIPRKQGRVDSWWRTGTSSKHQWIKNNCAYTRAILPRKSGQQGCYIICPYHASFDLLSTADLIDVFNQLARGNHQSRESFATPSPIEP